MTGARVYSLVFVVFRALLFCRLAYSSSFWAVPFLVSEVLCLVWSSVRKGTYYGWGWVVPWCYLVPLLFRTGEVLPNGVGVGVLWCLAVCQVAVRLRLGQAVTVGLPVFGGLVERWPYSVMRHPLAWVEMWLSAAVWFAFPSLWNWVIACMAIAAGVVAATIEDRFLRRFEDYRAYSARVPFSW